MYYSEDITLRQIHKLCLSYSKQDTAAKFNMKINQFELFLEKYGLSYEKLALLSIKAAKNIYRGLYSIQLPTQKKFSAYSQRELSKYLYLAEGHKNVAAQFLGIVPNTRKNKGLNNLAYKAALEDSKRFFQDEKNRKHHKSKAHNKEDLIQDTAHFSPASNKAKTTTKEEAGLQKISKLKEIPEVLEYIQTIKRLEKSPACKNKRFLPPEDLRKYFQIGPSKIPFAGNALFLKKALPETLNQRTVILGYFKLSAHSPQSLEKLYGVNQEALNIDTLIYPIKLGKNSIGLPELEDIELAKKMLLGPFYFMNHAPYVYLYRFNEDISALSHRKIRHFFNNYDAYILSGNTLYFVNAQSIHTFSLSNTALRDHLASEYTALNTIFDKEEAFKLASKEDLDIVSKVSQIKHLSPANAAVYIVNLEGEGPYALVEILHPLKAGDEITISYGADYPYKKQYPFTLAPISNLDRVSIKDLKTEFEIPIKMEEEEKINIKPLEKISKTEKIVNKTLLNKRSAEEIKNSYQPKTNKFLHIDSSKNIKINSSQTPSIPQNKLRARIVSSEEKPVKNSSLKLQNFLTHPALEKGNTEQVKLNSLQYQKRPSIKNDLSFPCLSDKKQSAKNYKEIKSPALAKKETNFCAYYPAGLFKQNPSKQTTTPSLPLTPISLAQLFKIKNNFSIFPDTQALLAHFNSRLVCKDFLKQLGYPSDLKEYCEKTNYGFEEMLLYLESFHGLKQLGPNRCSLQDLYYAYQIKMEETLVNNFYASLRLSRI